MATSHAMETVVYDRSDYLFDPKLHVHPFWLTDKHVIFHLSKDGTGVTVFIKSPTGDYIQSPRRLVDICSYRLVTDIKTLGKALSKYLHLLPSNLHPRLLREAILQREPPAVEWLISTWPSRSLRILDVIPIEDYLEDDYLTLPFEWNRRHACLVDSITLGLLKQHPSSRLRRLDFSGFPKDRRLCRDLCRLPILWMKPGERTVDNLHEKSEGIMEITKDKIQRILNRISVIYQNIDNQFEHGHDLAKIDIVLDLKITLDDAPLALALQHDTPFNYISTCVWMKHLDDVTFLPTNLDKVIDVSMITHFEDEDPTLADNDLKLRSLVNALASMKNLVALSLPNCIDVNENQTMATSINSCLRDLKHLKRLNFSYCNLKGGLEQLIRDLRQDIEYFNLKDCRLNEDDLFYLLHWRQLRRLRELNLSCNPLSHLDQVVIALMQKMLMLNILSVSYCSLAPQSLILIAQECREMAALKVICMQSYVPLPEVTTYELLRHFCCNLNLQQAILFPEVYAFPGHNDQERSENRIDTLMTCYSYLELRGRPDIALE